MEQGNLEMNEADDDLILDNKEGNMDYKYEMFSRLMLLKLKKSREKMTQSGEVDGD